MYFMHILKTTTPTFLTQSLESLIKIYRKTQYPGMSIFVLIGEKVSVWLLVVWLQGTATGLQMEDCCRSTLCVLCPTLHSSHTLRGHLLAVVSSWDISITISG